jgi:hypothetical protein
LSAHHGFDYMERAVVVADPNHPWAAGVV